MYFARTLLIPVLLIGGLVEVASAQHQYIFPQFAFGGGWESTLMVQARTPTTCTFSAQGRFFTMQNPSGSNLSGTSIPLTFGMNGWTILKTATPQGMAVSSGMAVLDCSEEVSANTLFSLEVGGSLVAEAVVESAEEIVAGGSGAQFLADHRDGARFGMAVANPSNQSIDVSVRVGDMTGQTIANTTVNVPANAAQAFFVDDLVTIPTGHTGQVLIGATGSVYVVGLRFFRTGVFTTIPATVQQTTATPDNPAALWSHSGTGNTVFDKPTSATRVRVIGEYDGSGQNFIVRCGGSSIINTIIGTGTVADVLRYEGVHNMGQCGEVEIVSSEGVSWSFTEVR